MNDDGDDDMMMIDTNIKHMEPKEGLEVELPTRLVAVCHARDPVV